MANVHKMPATRVWFRCRKEPCASDFTGSYAYDFASFDEAIEEAADAVQAGNYLNDFDRGIMGGNVIINKNQILGFHQIAKRRPFDASRS
jgi:hypothetical protein